MERERRRTEKGRGTSRKKGVEPRHTDVPRGRGTSKRQGAKIPVAGVQMRRAPDEFGVTMITLTITEATGIRASGNVRRIREADDGKRERG